MKQKDASKFAEAMDNLNKRLDELFEDVNDTIADLSNLYSEMFVDIEETLKNSDSATTTTETKDGKITTTVKVNTDISGTSYSYESTTITRPSVIGDILKRFQK
jgi:hypothetical protein